MASTLTYLAFGAVTEGWMKFAVIIAGNLLGGGAAAVLQGIVSNSADARSQGRTMGAVAALNSLTAVRPRHQRELAGRRVSPAQGRLAHGLPFYFCAVLQLVGTGFVAWYFHKALRKTDRPVST
jgi:DHA1 family tetracycline resistance protein-like MFS transporter